MKRVFIVGSPRSGTTLLQSILGAHSSFHTFPESHFFYAIYGSSSLRRNIGFVNKAKAYRSLKSFLETTNNDELRCQIPKNAWYELKWINAFKSILDQITEKYQKNGWLEKTPMHLHFIRQISRYIPESKFVHILRDSKDTIASMYYYASCYPKQWGKNRTLESCIYRWKLDTKIHQRYLNRENHYFVQYETLASKPDKEIRKICNFLNIDYQEGMLLNRKFEQIVSEREVWKRTVSEEISMKSSKMKLLTKQEQDLIQNSVGTDTLYV